MAGAGPTKDVDYLHPIDDGVRLRAQLRIVDGQLSQFAVSLECTLSDGKWRRVACFDNWGGMVHRDRYNPDGTDYGHHERMCDSLDVHQALRWVKDHIYANLLRYVEEFKANF